MPDWNVTVDGSFSPGTLLEAIVSVIRPQVSHWRGVPQQSFGEHRAAASSDAYPDRFRVCLFPQGQAWRLYGSWGLNLDCTDRRQLLATARRAMDVLLSQGNVVELLIYDDQGEMRWSLLEQPASETPPAPALQAVPVAEDVPVVGRVAQALPVEGHGPRRH